MSSLSTSDGSQRRLTSDLPHIAFVGGAGAGKTTLADYLFNRYPYNKQSFAAPLKDLAVRIWGPTAAVDRDKLQRLGGAVRDIDSDAWCNLLRGRIYNDQATPTVVDDCRFPNEYKMLREFGFIFIRVEAARSERIDRLRQNGKLTDEAQLEHESEKYSGLFPVDYAIENPQGYPEVAAVDLEKVLDREAAKR